MKIAVDIRFTEEYRNFIYETFSKITALHPEHSFIFIFDKPHDPSLIFSENVTPLIVKHQKISLLNDRKISSLLKKYKADVFLTAQTISQTKIPQCLIAHDIVKPGLLKKAKSIIAASEFSKKEISKRYKIDDAKIDVVYKPVSKKFQPILFEEKEKIKEQYSEGNEYFLAAVEIHFPNDLLNLLKAFSIFKKRQKSNMHLLIATPTELDEALLEKLRLFKFKHEVKILSNKEPEKITAAAYAFLHLFENKKYIHVLEAMQCDVPVLPVKNETFTEIFADTALYFDSSDPKDIADKMMLIFKDENLRAKLIEKGNEQVKKYSLDETADALWKSIEKACS